MSWRYKLPWVSRKWVVKTASELAMHEVCGELLKGLDVRVPEATAARFELMDSALRSLRKTEAERDELRAELEDVREALGVVDGDDLHTYALEWVERWEAQKAKLAAAEKERDEAQEAERTWKIRCTEMQVKAAFYAGGVVRVEEAVHAMMDDARRFFEASERERKAQELEPAPAQAEEPLTEAGKAYADMLQEAHVAISEKTRKTLAEGKWAEEAAKLACPHDCGKSRCDGEGDCDE